MVAGFRSADASLVWSRVVWWLRRGISPRSNVKQRPMAAAINCNGKLVWDSNRVPLRIPIPFIFGDSTNPNYQFPQSLPFFQVWLACRKKTSTKSWGETPNHYPPSNWQRVYPCRWWHFLLASWRTQKFFSHSLSLSPCLYIYIYTYRKICIYVYQKKFSWETSDIRTTSQSNRIAE